MNVKAVLFRAAMLAAQSIACAGAIYAVAAPEINRGASLVDRLAPEPDPLAVPRVSLPEVLLLRKNLATIVIDARTPAAFAQGHMPGAINVEPADADRGHPAIDRIARGQNVVIYCDGSGCLVGQRLARAIRERTGANALFYPGGWGEWRSLEFPIEN